MRTYYPIKFLVRGSLALVAAGILLAVDGQGAWAQEAWPEVETRDGIEIEEPGRRIEEPGRRIEEIVVTAERRESSVQDTSIAITAFTGKFLDDFGIRNQEDLQNFIPATTIQPYDATIRGVGRNFRALGGDPGVATYMNGIYSEDLLTATAATLWDVARVEVLRGPQGTLYGRNAVGGAINIIYKEPTPDYGAAFRSIYGNFGTQEYYGVLSGPLGTDKLMGRVNFSLRERDGVIDEIGWGSDLDGLGTKNVALQLKFEPTDNITMNIRQNFMRIDRSFGGANGGGLVVLNEDGKASRNTTDLVPGFRIIDINKTGVPTDMNYTDSDWNDASQTILYFPDPNSTEMDPLPDIATQANRPGLDFGAFDGYQNAAASLQTFNNDGLTGPQVDALAAPYNNCVFPGEINGSDLCAATNGLNREQFDQDGTQFSFAWNLTEDVELRYLFGYNELTYQRTTDDDNTASRVHDRQFYVNHEAQYSSHEVQAFVDVNDEISFTSGIFFYDATIDQRGDFYSSLDEARMRDAYVDATELSAGAAAFAVGVVPGFDPATATPEEIVNQATAVGTVPFITGLNSQTLAFGAAGVAPSLMVNLYSAKNSCMGPNPSPTCARNYSVGHSTTEDERNAALNLQTSGWFGDDGSNSELDAAHGPSTSATDLLYATQTKRDAFAVYTQGVWEFAESFSVTAGVRYARDEVTAEENLFRYSETGARPGFVDLAGDGDQGFLALYGGLSGVNAVNGGFEIDPGTGLPLYDQPTQKATNGGIPFALSVYRPFKRTDDAVTFRVNLDWDINESAMMYFSTTSGYRSGGYNLVFFSNSPTYEPEELLAYEVGYKTLFFAETLQVNGSFYLYDYDNIHTVATEVSAIGGTTTSVLAAPGARIWGIEADFVWLATDYLTVGGNFSYTPSEYTEDLLVKDAANIATPGSLFPEDNILYAGKNLQNINGNQLLQVPKGKATIWSSYRFLLPGGSDLEVFGTYAWVSEVYYSPFESALEKADAFGRLDFRANWRSSSERWGVSVFANNVLDDVGVLQVLREGESEFFRHSGGTTLPRLFGVEVTVALGGYSW